MRDGEQAEIVGQGAVGELSDACAQDGDASVGAGLQRPPSGGSLHGHDELSAVIQPERSPAPPRTALSPPRPSIRSSPPRPQITSSRDSPAQPVVAVRAR
jgi:hypothetical protein